MLKDNVYTRLTAFDVSHADLKNKVHETQNQFHRHAQTINEVRLSIIAV